MIPFIDDSGASGPGKVVKPHSHDIFPPISSSLGREEWSTHKKYMYDHYFHPQYEKLGEYLYSDQFDDSCTECVCKEYISQKDTFASHIIRYQTF